MDATVGTCIIDTVGDGADILHVVCLSESRRWIQTLAIAAHESGCVTTWPHPRWAYRIVGDTIEVTPSLRVIGAAGAEDQFQNCTPWRIQFVRSNEGKAAADAVAKNRILVDEWQRKFSANLLAPNGS